MQVQFLSSAPHSKKVFGFQKGSEDFFVYARIEKTKDIQRMNLRRYGITVVHKRKKRRMTKAAPEAHCQIPNAVKTELNFRISEALM